MIREITLELVRYSDIEKLSSLGKIRKLLNIAKQNKIALLEGRLEKEEETELIKTTMEEINEEFRGIELAVIDPKNAKNDIVNNMRNRFVSIVAGNRLGFTIIGPASVVKAIKKDPTKIQLLTRQDKKKKKR